MRPARQTAHTRDNVSKTLILPQVNCTIISSPFREERVINQYYTRELTPLIQLPGQQILDHLWVGFTARDAHDLAHKPAT